MKSLIVGLFLAFALTSSAQDKTEFSKIWDSGFNTYQSAEDYLSNGDKTSALKQFKKALVQFNKIKTADLTSWQDKIISYRMGLCQSNIEAIVRSISNGTPVEEVSKSAPIIQQNLVRNEKELKELREQRQSIEDTLKIYIDKYNQLSATNETIKRDLVDSTKQTIKYKSLNQVLSQKLSEADKKLQEQIIKSSKNLEAKLKVYDAKVSGLQKALTKLKNQRDKIQAYVESKEIEHDKLLKMLELQKIESKSLRSEVQSKSTTINSLKEQLQTIEANLGATKETTAKTNEYVSSQKLYITKLSNENTALKEEIKNTVEMLKKSDANIETSNKEKFQLKMFLQEKINEKNDLTSKLKEAKNELKLKESIINEANQKLRNGLAKESQLGEVIEIKNSVIKQKESQIKVNESTIADLKNQQKDTQILIASLKSRLVKEASDALNQKQSIQDLKSQISSLQAELVANKKIIASKDEAISQEVEGVSKLKEAMRIELTEKEQTKQTVEKLISEQESLFESIAKLNSKIDALKSEKTDVVNMLQKEKELNALKLTVNNKLKMELAKVKMELDSKGIDIAILNEQVIGLQNKLNIKESPLVKVKKQKKGSIPFTKAMVSNSSKTGTLYRIKSKSTYITHALVDSNRKAICYVHFTAPASKYERKLIQIDGKIRTVKGWKAPILDATNVTIK